VSFSFEDFTTNAGNAHTDLPADERRESANAQKFFSSGYYVRSNTSRCFRPSISGNILIVTTGELLNFVPEIYSILIVEFRM
jgi:hypothetical protein